MVGRSLLLFNICSGFEEPLALDISFIHNINPSQLVPTNAVNAVMPYNTTIPHGAPPAPQSSSSIPTPPALSLAKPSSRRNYIPSTPYFFLFCSRNNTCLRTVTSSSAKSPHFTPPKVGMDRAAQRTNRIVFQHAQRAMHTRARQRLVVARHGHGD